MWFTITFHRYSCGYNNENMALHLLPKSHKVAEKVDKIGPDYFTHTRLLQYNAPHAIEHRTLNEE